MTQAGKRPKVVGIRDKTLIRILRDIALGQEYTVLRSLAEACARLLERDPARLRCAKLKGWSQSATSTR